MAKILVVEDDDTIREGYELTLLRQGHQVQTAMDGKEASEAVAHFEPDLILLDMFMPTYSGIDFLKGFNTKNHPNTKIIISSNVSDNELVKQAMELGATKYMSKATLSPNDLVALVNETLGIAPAPPTQ